MAHSQPEVLVLLWAVYQEIFGLTVIFVTCPVESCRLIVKTFGLWHADPTVIVKTQEYRT